MAGGTKSVPSFVTGSELVWCPVALSQRGRGQTGVERRQGMKISVVGHCQSSGLASCMQAMLPDADVFSVFHYDKSPHLEESDLIFLLSDVVDLTDNIAYWEGVDRSRIKPIPSICVLRISSGSRICQQRRWLA